MSIPFSLLVLTALLAQFGLGYYVGHLRGHAAGRREGLREGPLKRVVEVPVSAVSAQTGWPRQGTPEHDNLVAYVTRQSVPQEVTEEARKAAEAHVDEHFLVSYVTRQSVPQEVTEAARKAAEAHIDEHFVFQGRADYTNPAYQRRVAGIIASAPLSAKQARRLVDSLPRSED